MILQRTLLTLSLVTILWVNAGRGLPSKRETDETDTATNAEDDYNPQCLPLYHFEKDQSEETRAKRDDAAVVAAEETQSNNDELVAQPGYVVPARRRRPCLGRRRNFTKDCGPLPRAYRVKNFVMAHQPPGLGNPGKRKGHNKWAE